MIKISNDGSIWFNEQHGNKISKFDPVERVLIEYWVPTQNREWGICSNDDYNNSINGSSNRNNNDTCGIANILQFSIRKNNDGSSSGSDGEIWFSECSENKIGKVESAEEGLPFSIDIFESDEKLTIERGEKEKIKLTVKAASESPSSSIDYPRLISSGTFTSSGDLKFYRIF